MDKEHTFSNIFGLLTKISPIIIIFAHQIVHLCMYIIDLASKSQNSWGVYNAWFLVDAFTCEYLQPTQWVVSIPSYDIYVLTVVTWSGGRFGCCGSSGGSRAGPVLYEGAHHGAHHGAHCASPACADTASLHHTTEHHPTSQKHTHTLMHGVLLWPSIHACT